MAYPIGYNNPYKVTSVLLIPDALKLSRFLHKDKSDYTFIKYVRQPIDVFYGLTCKYTAIFSFCK